MKLKTKWWGTSVPVKIVDEFEDWRAGEYEHGWVWPFAILRPGVIRILKGHVKDDILAHELQHATDIISPMRIVRSFKLKKARLSYWRETRAYAQSSLHVPDEHRMWYIDFFAKHIHKHHASFKSVEQIAGDILRLSKQIPKLNLK